MQVQQFIRALIMWE